MESREHLSREVPLCGITFLLHVPSESTFSALRLRSVSGDAGRMARNPSAFEGANVGKMPPHQYGERRVTNCCTAADEEADRDLVTAQGFPSGKSSTSELDNQVVTARGLNLLGERLQATYVGQQPLAESTKVRKYEGDFVSVTLCGGASPELRRRRGAQKPDLVAP